MSRYRRRPSGHKDSNHDTVVKELRALGVSVLETHALGDGAPDLIVGFRGITALVELKNGARYHHTIRKLRERVEKQQQFLDSWAGGLAFMAETTEAILDRLVDATLPMPSFAHARPALQDASWRPMSALLTPGPVAAVPPIPAPRPPMPLPTPRASQPTARARASAPATPES